MKRIEVYEDLKDQELKQKLIECNLSKAFPVQINYELSKLVDDHVPKKYNSRRSFVEQAIINQLKADGVIK